MSRHQYTDADVEYIKTNYSTLSIKEMSEYLGVTEAALKNKASELGVKKDLFYSAADEEYIREMFGAHTAKTIAKKMNRSVSSIQYKINKMGLGRLTDNTDSLCIHEVGKLTGTWDNTIKLTWAKNGLTIHKKGMYSMIRQDSLAQWMKTHPDMWDATKCDPDFFEYYEWFHPKLLEDRRKASERRWGA